MATNTNKSTVEIHGYAHTAVLWVFFSTLDLCLYDGFQLLCLLPNSDGIGSQWLSLSGLMFPNCVFLKKTHVDQILCFSIDNSPYLTHYSEPNKQRKKSICLGCSLARLLAVCRTVRRSMYAHKRRPGERQYKQILCHNACHTLSLTAWSVFVCNKTVSHLFRSSVAFPHSTDTRSVKLSFGDRKQIKRKNFYFKFSFNLICFIFPCQTQIVNSTVSDTLFAN